MDVIEILCSVCRAGVAQHRIASTTGKTIKNFKKFTGYPRREIIVFFKINYIKISAKSMLWLRCDAAGHGFMNRSIEREKERERDIWWQ